MAIEFLIIRTDGDWFDLKDDLFASTLRPTSFPSEPVEGWGDHRISVVGCEVSFSYEDPGIQVCFEGDLPPPGVARKIVDEIAARIAEVTGQKAEVVGL
jgi:hypothetical protein